MRFFLLLLLAGLWAQDKIRWGLYLRPHSGVGIGSFGKLKEDLKAANALGKDFKFVPWATTAGANLDFLIARKIVLSGGVQLQHFDASETERGQARPYALHYGGQIGYAAINKNLWLFYPYVGYQTGTYELRYTNYFNMPIYFGQNHEVRPLDKHKFSTQLGLVDVGVGVRRYLGGNGVCLVVGADLGGVIAPSGGKWKASPAPDPQGVQPPLLRGGYLRISLGIGYHKSGEPEAAPAVPTAEKPPKEKAEAPDSEPKKKEKKKKAAQEPTPQPEKKEDKKGSAPEKKKSK
ncbi:MAG: hypothetical protein NZ580_02490 [Bacteroidia bacterium]|nr:hypothetical protein [Bacteroidia bacterium]MDW8235646.1 hypothetical protein [Bacteroidia bacterium]